ncbi:unnamed protein product [Caenorhabditis angaria]|uniref:Uncharacterized protein n=1 Tax=Caenorhabditis angaria TaxID=860376 RepID=A0A9P1IFL0_9PELO|nr:unnamed protein product [Caenorhabditis angaria]
MSPIKSSTPYWFWVQSGDLESARISISLVESEQKIEFFSKFDKKKQNIVILYCVPHCEGQNLSIKIDFGKRQISTSLAINDSQEDNEQNSTMDRTIRELQSDPHWKNHSSDLPSISSFNCQNVTTSTQLEDNGAVENEEAGEPKPKLQKVWYGKNNSF